MSEENVQNTVAETKQNDKEINFRALEARYKRELAEATARAESAERATQELTRNKSQDDDDDSEPYVDHKRLQKKLDRFGQNTQSDIQRAMESAKNAAKEELKQEMWLENNPDFYDVLKHADKFAQRSPKLAESILRMPEGFERQKLVYQNIKELGVDQPEKKTSGVQEKVDANRRSPYYQPSGVGAPPYSSVANFSPAGQKDAYQKMKDLQSTLRI